MAAASLTVNVMARTKNFSQGMKRSSGALKGFTAKASMMRGMLLKMAGPLAGLAGVTGFGALAKNSLSTIDALAKTADKLGLTTQALGGMQHAAAISGVSSEKLNMGLQRMVRRVSEAAKGTGEARGALKELGVSAKALSMLSPDQQFLRIARAMQQVKTPSDRVRLAFKLFDSEGVSLVNTLGMGEDAIRNLMAEAVRLGIAPPRADAAKIEAVNDQFTRIGGAIKGQVNQALIAAAPLIKRATDAFLGLITGTSSFGERVMGVFGAVRDFIEPVVMGLWVTWKSVMGMMWEFAKNTFGAIGTFFQSVFEALGGGGGVFIAFRDAVVNAMLKMAFAAATWRDQLTLAFLKVQLGLVTFKNVMVHFGGTVIPTTLRFISDNWRTIWLDLFNFTKSVFTNLLNNAKNFGMALMSALRGEGFMFDWTPLTEGFHRATQQLKIPERVKSDMEHDLGLDVLMMQKNLEKGFQKFKDKHGFGKTSAAAPTAVSEPVRKAIDPLSSATEGAGSKLAKASIRGSQEAESIISRAISGRGTKQEELSKENNKQNDQIKKEIMKLGEKLGNPVQLAVSGALT